MNNKKETENKKQRTECSSLKIGSLFLHSNISLAPMAGITDYVLRSLVRKHSKTCLLTTEMISSEALIQEFKRKSRLGWQAQQHDTKLQSKCNLNLQSRLGFLTQQHKINNSLIATWYENDLILRNEDHSPIAYQLTGHKPQLMADAAKILEKYADIIDINMGCPVNKVVKGQDGCALMRNPKLAAEIVKTVKNSVQTPVSVKFRLGYTMEELNFADFGVKMQEAGADLITIHGRTRTQMYSGKADWVKIKELKQNVDVPIFANGDVNSIESAADCHRQSAADGIAIGRGILGDSTLISRIEHYFQTGEKLLPPTLEERIKTLKIHLDEEIKLRGENVGIKFVRKFYPYYINSVKNAAKYRAELVLEDDYDKIIKKLDFLQKEAICC